MPGSEPGAVMVVLMRSIGTVTVLLWAAVGVAYCTNKSGPAVEAARIVSPPAAPVVAPPKAQPAPPAAQRLANEAKSETKSEAKNAAKPGVRRGRAGCGPRSYRLPSGKCARQRPRQ